MDRNFKRPFLWPGAIAQDRERCQFPFVLDEKKTHCCTGRLAQRAIGRRAKGSLWRRSFELRASGATRLALGRRFGLVRLSGIDRLDEPADGAVRGSISPNG